MLLQTVLSARRGKKSKHGRPIRSGEVTRSRMRKSGAGTHRRDRSAWGGAGGRLQGALRARGQACRPASCRSGGGLQAGGCPGVTLRGSLPPCPGRRAVGPEEGSQNPSDGEGCPWLPPGGADRTKGQQAERCFTEGLTTRVFVRLFIHSLAASLIHPASSLPGSRRKF